MAFATGQCCCARVGLPVAPASNQRPLENTVLAMDIVYAVGSPTDADDLVRTALPLTERTYLLRFASGGHGQPLVYRRTHADGITIEAVCDDRVGTYSPILEDSFITTVSDARLIRRVSIMTPTDVIEYRAQSATVGDLVKVMSSRGATLRFRNPNRFVGVTTGGDFHTVYGAFAYPSGPAVVEAVVVNTTGFAPECPLLNRRYSVPLDLTSANKIIDGYLVGSTWRAVISGMPDWFDNLRVSLVVPIDTPLGTSVSRFAVSWTATGRGLGLETAAIAGIPRDPFANPPWSDDFVVIAPNQPACSPTYRLQSLRFL